MYTYHLNVPTDRPGNTSVPGNALSVLKRSILVALGLTFVAIGFVGVFLPGIPTTGPLIAASLLFAKSNPHLGRRLLANRVFRKYGQYLDDSRTIPLRARLWALACMWISIAASCVVMSRAGQSASTAIGITAAMGLIGSPVIFCYRRSSKKAEASRPLSEMSTVDLVEKQLLSEITAIQQVVGRPTSRTSSAGPFSSKRRHTAATKVRNNSL